MGSRGSSCYNGSSGLNRRSDSSSSSCSMHFKRRHFRGDLAVLVWLYGDFFRFQKEKKNKEEIG